jgi:hypothetical protein
MTEIFPERTIRKILARGELAEKAFNQLVGAKVDEDRLILDLYNILLNPPSGRGRYLCGKEDKTAKRFPRRIEKFALEIENVNTGTLFYELLLSHRRDTKAGRKQP